MPRRLKKSETDVKKSAMASAVKGFYNTFSMDDTTKLEDDLSDAEWVVRDVLNIDVFRQLYEILY